MAGPAGAFRRRWLGTLAVALLLGYGLPGADAIAQPASQPVLTRLVKAALEREQALLEAQARGDGAALDALLDADFELREAAQPGRPLPRAEWLAAALAAPGAGSGTGPGTPPGYAIEQMAVHEHGALRLASFLLRPLASSARRPALFIVDNWLQEGERWRLLTRYAATVAAGRGALTPTPDPRPSGR